MNLQTLLSEFSQSVGGQNSASQTPAVQNTQPNGIDQALRSVKNNFPGGLAGGAAAGGLVALLLGSKSTRKMATKVAKFGGTAVLGGLAYKAYSNWQANKALNQTAPISDQDIELALPQGSESETATAAQIELAKEAFELTLIKTMIAASKADGVIDAKEQGRIAEAAEKLNLSAADKANLFNLLAQDISINEIASAVKSDEAKAEIYLAAYLAIEVDDQRERAFLNDLSSALALPRGLSAYLEQQADQG